MHTRRKTTRIVFGNFLFDSLPDANGEIFIEGKPIKVDLDTVHAHSYNGRQTEDPKSGSMMTTHQQAVTISAGKDLADLNAFKNNFWFYRSIGSEIDNYKRK